MYDYKKDYIGIVYYDVLNTSLKCLDYSLFHFNTDLLNGSSAMSDAHTVLYRRRVESGALYL